MNEFEWRRQMRNLRQPVAPERDLWNAIDAALEARGGNAPAAQPAVRTSRQAWLLAATLAGVFLLVGGIGQRLQRTPNQAADTTTDTAWSPSDPRLSGAAIELDAARIELQQAMQQSPDSPALQRLLAHTERQQTQLRHLVHEAG